MRSPLKRKAEFPSKGRGSYLFDRGGGHLHQGVDVAAPRGVPLRAVTDGTVTHASNKLERGFSGYGRHVVVKQQPAGPWFLYAHLEQASVEPGAKVKAGDLVGTVGDSCFSRADPTKVCEGVHFHFEVSPTPYPQKSEAPRLDPVAWMRKRAPLELDQADDPVRLQPRPKEPRPPTPPRPGRRARPSSVLAPVLFGIGLLGILGIVAARKRRR